ncbi:MAG: hypothetical protein RSE24_06345, partial [Oscillospiraceae bacterium]
MRWCWGVVWQLGTRRPHGAFPVPRVYGCHPAPQDGTQGANGGNKALAVTDFCGLGFSGWCLYPNRQATLPN